MSRLLRLAQTTLIYSLGAGASGLLNVLAFFLLARALIPGELGYIELLLSFVPAAVALADGGMLAALTYYYYAEPDGARRRLHVTCGSLFNGLAGVGLSLAILAAALPLIDFLELPPAFLSLLYLFALLLALEILVGYAKNVLRIMNRATGAVAVGIIRNGMLLVLLGAVLVAGVGVDPSRFMLLSITAVGVALLYSLAATRSLYRGGCDTATMRKMLRYGAPAVVGALSIYLLQYVDRLVIQKFLAADQLGYYAVAFRIAVAATLIIQGFRMAWAPAMLKSSFDSGNAEIVVRGIRYFFFVNTAVLAALACFSPELVRLLADSRYQPAQEIVGLLGLGVVLLGAYDIFHSGIVLAKRLILHSLIIISGGVINLVLNLIAVPLYGIAGAAGATTASAAITAVLGYKVAQRVHPVGYDARWLTSAGILLIAVTLLPLTLHHTSLLYRGMLFIVTTTAIILFHREQCLGMSRLIVQRLRRD